MRENARSARRTRAEQADKRVHASLAPRALSAAIATATSKAVRRFVRQDGALTIIRNAGREQFFRNVLMVEMERATKYVGFTEGSRGKVKRIDLDFRNIRGSPKFSVETKADCSSQSVGTINRQTKDALRKVNRTSERGSHRFMVHAISDLWCGEEPAGAVALWVHNEVATEYKRFVEADPESPNYLEGTFLPKDLATCIEELNEGNAHARIRAWVAASTKNRNGSRFFVQYLNEKGELSPICEAPARKRRKKKRSKTRS